MRNIGLLVAMGCFAAYVAVVQSLYARPRVQVSAEMQVALPRFVQVLMSAGDRFLAADLAGFRALIVSTAKMTAESYHILGKVHSDVAWLNPAHEDNYYIAAAILPWNGEVAAAQYVLKQATLARPYDWQPPFYYGVNAFLYLKNPVEGSKWMMLAADRTPDEIEQLQLQQLAANVVSKGDDIDQSIRLHRMMAKGTRHKAFAKFLEKRIVRLENFAAINQAVTKYRGQFGKSPVKLKDLVDHAYLPSLPIDPFDMQYILDTGGKANAVDPAAASMEISRKMQ